MNFIIVEDLKENDSVEGYYKEVRVKGKVKIAFGRKWLEVKARPAGRMRIPLGQIEAIRCLRFGKKGVER